MLIEIDVEVTDQVSLDAYLLEDALDPDGAASLPAESTDLPGCPGSAQQHQVANALRGALADAMDRRPTGLRLLASSVLLRPRRNGVYEGIRFPAVPQRNDDGSLPA